MMTAPNKTSNAAGAARRLAGLISGRASDGPRTEPKPWSGFALHARAGCDTGDPCYHGEVLCGNDGQAYCVTTFVFPNCPPEAQRICVQGVSCDTGNPCYRGEIVCGADDQSHCVATAIEDVEGCP